MKHTINNLLKLLSIIPEPNYTPIQWTWANIDTSQLNFPSHFLWGTATASYQVEGNAQAGESNWSKWELTTDSNGRSKVVEPSGLTANHWELYNQDIELMKELGTNSYRFSIAWEKVMPTPTTIEESVLQHYEDVIDALCRNGIEPMITMHHFVHPLWFEEMGGFEKKENLIYFVNFAELIFKRFASKVKYWLTFNEVTVYTMVGYVVGNFPPGKVNDYMGYLKTTQLIFDAHVQTYQRLKSLPHGDTAQIGIVHSVTQFDPYRPNNLADKLICHFADWLYNQPFLRYFTKNRQYIDFIGVNYYSHNALAFNWPFSEIGKPLPYPGEAQTDMGYTIYPEGLYRAIARMATLNKPMYITENGIGINDARDAERAIFIERVMYVVSKAIRDNYPVMGYFYWSLLDNYEWDVGYHKQFGLYRVNRQTHERSLKDGAKVFQKIARQFTTQSTN